MMGIINLIKDVFGFIIDKLRFLLEFCIEKFLDINIFDKLIILNTITAFFAIVLPVASHYIFNIDFMINNPFAVYLIGIVGVMYVTMFFPGKISLVLRIFLNGYYYFWIIYLHYGKGIVKTEYVLKIGYYVNIAVPMIYVLLALLSFIWEKRR